ncbi:MAG: hypothetical protein RLY66_30 [Candidatus Parcubacteria bacterium]|jgi:hypothetical protein
MNKDLQGGYIIMLHTLIFLGISLVVLFGIALPIISHHAAAMTMVRSKQSFLLTDSAAGEAIYRLENGLPLASSQTITLGGASATIATANTSTGKTVTVTTPGNEYERNIRIHTAIGTGISFHYGIQSGRGGFVLENTSSVTGNVFSGGTITGSSNYIYGDAVSTGPTGLITGINVTGSAYAHTLQNSSVGSNAFYTVKTSTTVGGTSNPNSPDLDDEELPISDEQIAEWEAQAETGGTSTNCSSGTYTISSSVTLGPLKIPCNLVIRSNGTIVTVTGPIWVTGNITTQNAPLIRMSSSLGNQNVAIIADNPSDRLSSSRITIGQNTSFQNSGVAGSFVFMISQNNSSENGGSVNAIDMGQGASALVAYASHGQISLGQSVSVKEATGYKIVLRNSANVTYDTGLPSVLFSSGPGGGYTIIDWNEI